MKKQLALLLSFLLGTAMLAVGIQQNASANTPRGGHDEPCVPTQGHFTEWHQTGYTPVQHGGDPAPPGPNTDTLKYEGPITWEHVLTEAYDETVVDHEAYDETVVDSPAVDGQHYSLKGNSGIGKDDTPLPPGPGVDYWQANTTQEPHGSDNITWLGSVGSGLHYASHGSSGNRDWFYYRAPVPAVTHVVHHAAVTHVVHHDAVTEVDSKWKIFEREWVPGTECPPSHYPVKDASGSVTVTQPSCVEGYPHGGTITIAASHATFPSQGVITPGEHSIVFTADAGHAFPAGPGVSNFGHTLTVTYTLNPTPSKKDCSVMPEPRVEHKSDYQKTCDAGVQKRTWDLVFTPYWDDEESEWVFPQTGVIANDTGWVFVRNLTDEERKYLHCKTTVPVPATPSQNDPCGSGNAYWIVPANTDSVKWALVEGNLVATTNPGYVFADGTYSHNYGKPVDSGAGCITYVAPVNPTVTKATCNPTDVGVIPGSVVLPPNTVLTYTYNAATGIVTATSIGYPYYIAGAPAGWTVSPNGLSATYKVDLGDPGDCRDVIESATPTYSDDCDVAPSWDPFPVVAHASWSTDEDGNAVLTADEGYAFKDGGVLVQSLTFNLPADDGAVCPVNVRAHVSFMNKCGTAHDTFKAENVLGVYYTVNGQRISEGVRLPASGRVVVRAHSASAHYILTGKHVWSHRFGSQPCHVPPHNPPHTGLRGVVLGKLF